MKRWRVGERDWRSWALASMLIVLFLIQLLVMPSAVQAVATSVWVERKPAGDLNRNWLACASDATGQRLLAGDNGGRLWISVDAGESWSEAGAVAGGAVRNWQACASDDDGSTLIAGVSGVSGVSSGRLYTSTDFGASWTAAAPGGLTDENWKAVASDDDGSTLIAAVWNGRVYGSADAGAKWVELQPAGDIQRNWQAIACDENGRHIMALTRNNGPYGSGDAYASSDAGATWIVVHPGGSATLPWKACAMDEDGSTLVVAAYPGRLYLSVDAGTTWTELQPMGDVDRNWQAVAVDADGFHIVAVVDGGGIWTSSDAGISWNEIRPSGVLGARWQCCASSEDGSRLIAGAYEGRLYTGLVTWSLSYACTAGGVIEGAASQTVNHGANGTTVTATPNVGYHFVSWSDGILTAARTDTNVTVNVNVSASFAINTYTIVASAGANGNISPSGDVTVNHGSSQSFTINPGTGYHVQDVFVDTASVGAVTSYTFTNLTENHTIAVTFAINPITISTYTVTYTAGANGTISGTSPQTVNRGASGTTVTATPNVGYHFVSWSDASTVNPRTDTNVTADIIVTATFAIDTFTLTASAGANGAMDPSGSMSVNYGSTQSFTINPSTGYHVLDVLVDGSTVGAAPSYTFTNVTAAHTIVASFAINTYTIVASAGLGGNISPSGNVTVNHGASQSFTISPSTSYHVSSILVDGAPATLTGAAYTFTNVTAAHTIATTFAVDMFAITVISGSHGTVTPGTGLLPCHAAQAYVVKPDAGYMIDTLTVDGVVVNEATNRLGYTVTFTSIEGPHTIVATFTPIPAPVNDVPSFTKGADQTVAEDCSAQSVAEWATNISAGPADEAGQVLHFDVTNDNNALFSVQPAVSPTGILTYTPAADMNGSATVTLHIHDDGGTANGGVDTSASQTFAISVTTVNDPPVNTSPPSIAGTMNVGDTLTASIGTWNDTVDTSVSGSSTLTYAYQWVRADDASGTNAGDIASATAPSYVLSDADSHRYLRVWITCTDDGVGLPATQSVTLPTPWTPQVINRLPSITEGASTSITMDEDGSPLAWSLTLNAMDVDSDTLTWSISTPASHGTATADGTGYTKAITYTPAADWNGSDSFMVRVSDGYGGTASIAVDISVNAVNDPPVNTAVPVISGIPHVGRTLATTDGVWNDAIDTSVSGTSAPSFTYQWQRSTDGGFTFVDITGATGSSYALILRDNLQRVRVRVTCSDTGVGEGLPISLSTSADSAFLPARYLDMMPPIIELPDFSSRPGLTGVSGGTTPSFTVTDASFALPFTIGDDRLDGVQWSISVGGRALSTPDSTGSFSRVLSLSEGPNDVQITAVDAAGNSSSRHLTITLDTHAPEVTLATTPPLATHSSVLNIAGAIRDSLSSVRSLSIDGVPVIPYLDGTFRYELTLKKGDNTVVIASVDGAGNYGSQTYHITYVLLVATPVSARQTIVLTIGSKTMVVDGTEVALDAPAALVEDRTLVPLRALVEHLGGTISWNAKTRQVTVKARGTAIILTIGKNTALVNGKSLAIDPKNSKVVPLISSGCTMLPLRFVAENLSLQVGWNAKAKAVTLTWGD